VGLAIVALGAVLLAASTQPRLRAEMQETAKPEIAAQNVPTPAVAGEKPCAGCGEKRTADRGTLPYLCTHFPIMYFDEIALFEVTPFPKTDPENMRESSPARWAGKDSL
jgi:hypothetical protein